MRKHCLVTALSLTLLTGFATAQRSILNTRVTFEFRQQPLGRVLEMISTTGDFNFSYTGTLFNKDSLVTLPAQTRSVHQLLDSLFHGRVQYLEDGRYLILLPAINKTTQSLPEEKDRRFVISGTILDQRTGQPLIDVSVYDPEELSATMSKSDGSFIVRIKNKGRPVILAVSKEAYIDTIVQLRSGSNRDLTISISPDAFPPKALLLSAHPYWSNDSIRVEYPIDSFTTTRNLVPGVETTGFARILLSYRLRMQSYNLNKIFVTRPVQLSFIPGWSTNGPLNSQVTNKVSINVIGGYEAGLHGVELGGVFNIDKKNLTGVQAAGVVNVVGGPIIGAQLAGVCNKDLDTVYGIQAAGVINLAKTVRGIQAAPINHTNSMHGFQYGIINHTHLLKGVQFGIINIADSSRGISFGPINLSKNGLHELSFYADELSPFNLAFRSGHILYSILYAGVNPGTQRRSYYYGYGYGIQCPITHNLAIRPEFTAGVLSPLSLHHFDDNNGIFRFNLDLHWKPAKNFAISFGPSANFYFTDKSYYVGGTRYEPVPHSFLLKNTTDRGWIGWHVAVNLF
jgi:hypothetical protein